MNITLGWSTALPPWVVLPLAAGTVCVIARHVMELQRIEMPASRRRIRTANGLLMILVAALLGYALGIMRSGPTSSASISEVRTFVMVWGVIIGLLPIVIGLAILDAMNNIRLHLAAQRGLRAQLGSKLARELVVLTRRHGDRSLVAAGGGSEDGLGGAGSENIMDDGISPSGGRGDR